jgi:transposase
MQVDFGECIGVIGCVRMKLHVFCFDLPQSDACFIKAYPAEDHGSLSRWHVSAFAFFGGVPISILYDNRKIAVARILGDGTRQRARAFTELSATTYFKSGLAGNDKARSKPSPPCRAMTQVHASHGRHARAPKLETWRRI